jgi:ferritin-like metal-binding protein YciE
MERCRQRHAVKRRLALFPDAVGSHRRDQANRRHGNPPCRNKETAMQLDSLNKLYEDTLKDLHSAERQILEALPRMIKATTNGDLQGALEEHRQVTEEQLARLDSIFQKMGKKGQGKRCKGMEGLLEEGKELLSEDAEPEVLDAGIIAAAQKVEHYEISGYGTAAAYARLLGETEAEKLLRRSLEEEKEADQKLNELAESGINVEAHARG